VSITKTRHYSQGEVVPRKREFQYSYCSVFSLEIIPLKSGSGTLELLNAPTRAQKITNFKDLGLVV
jgi:hypothetical protein